MYVYIYIQDNLLNIIDYIIYIKYEFIDLEIINLYEKEYEIIIEKISSNLSYNQFNDKIIK